MIRRGAGGAIGVVLLLAACAPVGDDSQAGFGLPSVDDVPGPHEGVQGTLHVEQNGCFTLELDDDVRPWAVWPPGAEHDGDHVVLPGGERVGEGAVLTGTGVLGPADLLPDWANQDSYFHSFGTFCAAEDRGVVLLVEVRPLG